MRKFVTFKVFANFLAPLFLFSLSCYAFAQPQITQESDVQNCQYLDQIEGTSGYGKNVNWQTLAKHSALSRAEKMDATHIVWVEFNPVGGFNGIAVAKAYDCQMIGALN